MYSKGNNIYYGGSGTDSINYATSNTYNAYVYLNASVAYIPGASKTDYIFDFENVIGTPNDDIIVGNNGNNLLNAGAGND